jgi:hypothetical protein
MTSKQTSISAGAVDDPELVGDPVIRDSEEKSPGVLRMEMVASVFTKWDKILLFTGLFLGSCE